MKKKKKSQHKKVTFTDRTYLGPKGVHTHPPQRKNEGPFEGKVYVKRARMFLEYINWNKKGKTDIGIWKEKL